MNFCEAILILKMEEDTQHFWCIMLYYFKKSKNATQTQKKICAVCGEGAVTDRTCQKWFETFRATNDAWPNNSLLWGCLVEDVEQHPGLYPLNTNSGRQPTFSNYPNQ